MKSTSRWLAFACACACAFALACGGGGTSSGGTPTDPGGTPTDPGGTPTDPGGTPTDPGGIPTDPKRPVVVKKLADCPVCPLPDAASMNFWFSAPAMALGGKGYMRIGTDFYAYDPQSDTWAKKSGAISENTYLFALEGRGYRVTSQSLSQYDPERDSWTAMTAPPINGPVSFVFTIGGKVYVGGFDGDSQKRVFRYDPAVGAGGTWSEVTRYPGSAVEEQRCHFVLNGLGYVGGGRITRSTAESYQDFWSYNPASNAWARETDLPSDDLGVTGLFTSGDGRGVMGSWEGLWSYDPGERTWSLLEIPGDVPDLNDYVGAFAIGSKGYVLSYDGSLYSVEVNR